jgi:ribonuclease HI
MCNEWIRNWARNHWMNSKKVEVENIDLVKEIYNYIALDFPNFQITKVPGHSGVLGNELADALATNNKAKFDKILSENDISGQMEIFFDF